MARNREDPSRKGRKVRIHMRKNRADVARDGAELTRRQKRGDQSVDDEQSSQNVRAKGDLSRKRTIMLGDEGAERSDLHGGLVVAMRGLIAEVDDGARVWACTVRGMLKTRRIDERQTVTVGDQVHFAPVFHGDQEGTIDIEGQTLPEGVIESVEERQTLLVRDYENKRHVMAANVDTVVITVAAAMPTLRPHLIDRYLVSIHKGEMRPIVCINKIDLDADGGAAVVAQRYRDIGYNAVETCVADQRGVEILRGLIREKTCVFVGPSGVGKSSLINALAPGFALKIGTMTDLERGKHTTTTARLLRWPFGGYVVDTPGTRQFELPGVEADELDAYFAEFVDLLRDCRFSNCTHTHEIKCAVKTAVEEGRISTERYDSYCKMYAECAARPRY